jgi:hypothetical protein
MSGRVSVVWDGVCSREPPSILRQAGMVNKQSGNSIPWRERLGMMKRSSATCKLMKQADVVQMRWWSMIFRSMRISKRVNRCRYRLT